MSRKRRRDSTLISLVTQDGVVLHGYLLAAEASKLDMALQHMEHAAEELGLRHLNVWLSTGPMVRDPAVERIVRKSCPDGAGILDNYKGGDFVSLVAWLMRDGDADSETLMAVH